MIAKKNVLLLVGSAKGQRSTSASLGAYLLAKLQGYGFEATRIRTHKAIKTDAQRKRLIHAVQEADVIVLSFPLYVDCLPYTVTRTLEILADHFNAQTNRREQRFLAIANCGYPESRQNQTAIDICRQFARQTGLVWAGGLALGGGGAIAGQPLEKVKGVARHVIKSLDLTAEALSKNLPVPEKAVELMARQLIPTWLYRTISHIQFLTRARRYGTSKLLKRCPFVSKKDDVESNSPVHYIPPSKA